MRCLIHSLRDSRSTGRGLRGEVTPETVNRLMRGTLTNDYNRHFDHASRGGHDCPLSSGYIDYGWFTREGPLAG